MLGAEAHDFAAADGGTGAPESEGREVVEAARGVRRPGGGADRLGKGGAERGGEFFWVMRRK